MKCLVVQAHPLDESLCATLVRRSVAALQSSGHEVAVEDLCRQGFEPSLTPAERASYYADYDASAVAPWVERLLWAEGIVLLFPTWWFGFPAVLKGWFDRVWGPGIAYDHAVHYGPIKSRLHNLHEMLAVTTLGAPAWVDTVLLRRPVKKVLKTAILGTCAPKCRLRMLSLYKSEKLTPRQVERFVRRVEIALSAWKMR